MRDRWQGARVSPDPNSDWWGSTLALRIDGANARVITTEDTTAIHDARKAAKDIAAADTLRASAKSCVRGPTCGDAVLIFG